MYALDLFFIKANTKKWLTSLSRNYKDSFDNDVDVLIELVWLGLLVQLIEGTFYTWLASFINTVENITQYRYYDWFFSTPTMLIIFVVYLILQNLVLFFLKFLQL